MDKLIRSLAARYPAGTKDRLPGQLVEYTVQDRPAVRNIEPDEPTPGAATLPPELRRKVEQDKKDAYDLLLTGAIVLANVGAVSLLMYQIGWDGLRKLFKVSKEANQKIDAMTAEMSKKEEEGLITEVSTLLNQANMFFLDAAPRLANPSLGGVPIEGFKESLDKLQGKFTALRSQFGDYIKTGNSRKLQEAKVSGKALLEEIKQDIKLAEVYRTMFANVEEYGRKSAHAVKLLQREVAKDKENLKLHPTLTDHKENSLGAVMRDVERMMAHVDGMASLLPSSAKEGGRFLTDHEAFRDECGRFLNLALPDKTLTVAAAMEKNSKLINAWSNLAEKGGKLFDTYTQKYQLKEAVVEEKKPRDRLLESWSQRSIGAGVPGQLREYTGRWGR